MSSSGARRSGWAGRPDQEGQSGWANRELGKTVAKVAECADGSELFQVETRTQSRLIMKDGCFGVCDAAVLRVLVKESRMRRWGWRKARRSCPVAAVGYPCSVFCPVQDGGDTRLHAQGSISQEMIEIAFLHHDRHGLRLDAQQLRSQALGERGMLGLLLPNCVC